MKNEQMERREAEILQMSVAELRELEQIQADQKTSDRLGVDPWEIRWMRNGKTEEA